MQISEIKDLLSQFDASSLREFSYATSKFSLSFSKNNGGQATVAAPVEKVVAPQVQVSETINLSEVSVQAEMPVAIAEGDVVKSPLVGVAYLKPAPDKSDFIAVGETVKKGQTLLIIEAMKVMNEIPAPHDGVITEILVSPESMVEYGEELVRIK
ncbi:acetyl-CoA carboxylase biotin carboxyl carrier protein [Pseudolactococcus hodotermopsidis]|uniref:acetyl-CoA carboxylase biotin carboxyl carrier protein n=1 Tax=Pseudolactococcus hodotermopsidis TaxID=2709157 RepID=UPI00155705AA|nr:acetyl-CoA carboxylase biotin carboxyl carrier protein [Lactococcus hodotermopsidis]